MSSKVRRAISVLNNDGPLTLAKKTGKYIFYPTDTERHIEHLQERENLVIAEIGVWRGANAERLAKELDVAEMYLIDPYDAYEEYDESKSEVEKMQSARKEAHNRLEGQSNINWMEMYSDEAVNKIEKELDYVYVDGNHSYEFVKTDMTGYYQLLKEGGILAGDDMDWEGVAQAFVEFSVENNLQPHLEPYHPDWYFIKGQEMQS